MKLINKRKIALAARKKIREYFFARAIKKYNMNGLIPISSRDKKGMLKFNETRHYVQLEYGEPFGSTTFLETT